MVFIKKKIINPASFIHKKCRINIKLLVVISLTLVVFDILPKTVGAVGASLFLSPASKSFIIGDNFSMELKVDTADIPINAAQATIYFPAEQLEVMNISTGDSIFVLWPEEPNFSNSSGEILFSGGLPTPGFTGIGNIITINFKTKQEGQVNLILEEAKVLADDGEGTDILVFIKEAKYSLQKTIVPAEEIMTPIGQIPANPQIFSSSHPQSNEWYNNNNPYFQWVLSPDIIGVSFIFDQNPETIPDTHSEGLIQSKIYEGSADGIWYFHLRLENTEGWSLPSHYKIQIDSSPPSPFEITIDNAGDSTNPDPKLYFKAEDDTSGISYYKFKIGERNFLKLMLAQINPISLSHLPPGRHPIIVRAADKAGNNVESKTVIGVEPIESPQITLWPEIYISGEEIFYIEGRSLPEVEVMIFLEKDGEKIKNWQALSNSKGEWSFSTKELIKSGIYYLSAQARDKRGAMSYPSESRKIKVSLSGISLGQFMVSLRTLISALSLIIFLGIIIVGYFIYKIKVAKKILRRETREVKESVERALESLKKEIEKRIEMFNSQPGFSKKERQVYEDLEIALKISEGSINKEIKDVEKLLE